MALLDEAIREDYETETAENAAPEFETAESYGGPRYTLPNLDFLKAPTGPGAIEDYIDHPLNFDGEKSTARIIRGCTGIFGALDFGLTDIILGVVEKIHEKNKGKKENANRPQEQPYIY